MKLRFLLATALAALAAALSPARQAHAASCSPFSFVNGITLGGAALNSALAQAAQLGSQCAGDGNAAAPGFSFQSTPSTGFHRRSDGGIGIDVAGIETMDVLAGAIVSIPGAGALQLGTGGLSIPGNAPVTWGGLNIGDGTNVAVTFGSPGNSPYAAPNGVLIAGPTAISTDTYGYEGLSSALSVLAAHDASPLHLHSNGGGNGGFEAGVPALARYGSFDSIALFTQNYPEAPLITQAVASYSGSENRSASAATVSGAVLHFGAGSIPSYIMQGVGVTATNVPAATIVSSVNYTTGDVTLSANVTGGGVANGASVTFGVGRATFTTPLTAAQVAMLRINMWVLTDAPTAVGSYLTGWDPSGAWVEVVGWAVPGGSNAAFNQLATGANLRIGLHTSYFTRNTVISAESSDLGTAWVADEIDVLDHLTNADPRNAGGVAQSLSGLSILGFGSLATNHPGTGIYIAGQPNGSGGNWSFYIGENIVNFMAIGLAISDGGVGTGVDLKLGATVADMIQAVGPASTLVYKLDHSGNTTQTGNLALGSSNAGLLSIGATTGGASVTDLFYFYTQGGTNWQVALTASGGTSSGNDGTLNMYAARIVFNGIPVIAAFTTPTTSGAPCSAGNIYADTNYIYLCTATNTWKRATLASF